MTWQFQVADCIEYMRSLPENSVDLVFGSPQYMDARTYGIDACRDCQLATKRMLAETPETLLQ